MCAADKVWISELKLIHKNIRSVRNARAQVYRSIWRKTHYDVTHKNNNVSSEGLDRHYHKYHRSSNSTHWDISDNVCLDLQNCRYSIYTIISFKTYWYILCRVLVKVPTQTHKVAQSFPKWEIHGAISMGSCYNTESLTVAHSGYDV
jgi:hypothetical protein